MRKSIIALILSLLTTAVTAQNTRLVRGVVNGPDGRPIIGATIKAVDENATTTSTLGGEFKIRVSYYCKFVEAHSENYLTSTAEIDGSFIIFTLKADKKNIKAKEQARLEAEKASKDKAKSELKLQEKARIEAQKAMAAKAEAERKAQERAKIAADKKAAAKAKAEKQARIVAKKEAVAKAKVERKSQKKARIEANKKASAKAKTEKQARIVAKKEAVAKAKADHKAQKKARIEANKKASAKAKAEKQARIVAEKEAVANAKAKKLAHRAAVKEAVAKAKAESKAQEKAEKVQLTKIKGEDPKGFASIIDLSYMVGMDGIHSSGSIRYIAGYHFNEYLYIGGGAGVNYNLGASPSIRSTKAAYSSNKYLNPSLISVPVFAYLRANFTDRRCTPFFALAAGCNLAKKQTLSLDYGDIRYNNINAFILPQLGLNFRITSKNSFYIAIGYQCFNNWKVLAYSGRNAIIKQFPAHGINFHLGITF